MTAELRAPLTIGPGDVIFSRDGDAEVESGLHRWYAARNVRILRVLTSAGVAPVGGPLVFDVLVHDDDSDPGSSIFTTTANRPTLDDGEHESETPAPDVANITAGQYLTVDTLAVPSPTPGSKLDLRILYA